MNRYQEGFFFSFLVFLFSFGIYRLRKNGVKEKPKLRKQDEAFPHLYTKIAFWENFA